MTTLIDNTDRAPRVGTRVYDPVGEHLTTEPGHERFQDTFIGMAHIAGTGPEGSACCECKRFGDVDGKPVKRYGFRKGTKTPGELYPGYCHRFVHGKRFQMFPGDAKSCSLFERSTHPRKFRKNPPEKEGGNA